MKKAQAREAFSTQKRSSSTKNMKILFLWVIFSLLDPDPAIRINADPQP